MSHGLQPVKRRKYPRYYTGDILVELEGLKDKKKSNGSVINIATDGFCGKFNNTLMPDQRVDIRLDFIKNKGGDVCQGKGRIIWKEETVNDICNYGIQFINTNDTKTALENISNYIDSNIDQTKVDERRIKERRCSSDKLEKGNNDRRKSERRIDKSIFKKCVENTWVDFLNKQNVYFQEYDTAGDVRVVQGDREFISFSYCNYLGLNNDDRIKQVIKDSIDKYGTTTASSRLACGTMPMHNVLERKLAEFIGGEDCLTYILGYLANFGGISAIVRMNDFIVMDAKSHASIIDGAMLSRGRLVTYKHNDMSDLEKQLRRCSGNKLIVTDGVFSMDGDIAKLDDIYYLGQKYDAGIFLDDAHGIGVIGKDGRGTPEYFGLEGKIDLVMGTLTKACPLLGGYIVGREKIINYLRWMSRSFMFNLSLPPYIVEGIITVLDIIKNEPELRLRLRDNVKYIREGLKREGFKVGESDTGILPVFIGDNDKTCKIGESLKEMGIIVDSVVYPVVKKSASMLRIVMSASHSEEDLDQAINAFKKAKESVGL